MGGLAGYAGEARGTHTQRSDLRAHSSPRSARRHSAEARTHDASTGYNASHALARSTAQRRRHRRYRAHRRPLRVSDYDRLGRSLQRPHCDDAGDPVRRISQHLDVRDSRSRLTQALRGRRRVDAGDRSGRQHTQRAWNRDIGYANDQDRARRRVRLPVSERGGTGCARQLGAEPADADRDDGEARSRAAEARA